MSARPTIRAAGPDDAAALHAAVRALSRHLGLEHQMQSAPGDFSRHGFGARPLFRALIAEAGSEACGAAIFFPEFSTLRGQPGVYLQDLWVRAEHRRSGLGRRLLGAVTARAADWGASYMRLSAQATNAQALAFYRRLGFATERDEISFVIEGDGFTRLEGRQ